MDRLFIDVGAALADGLRRVARFPVVLVAAIPQALWAAITVALGMAPRTDQPPDLAATGFSSVGLGGAVDGLLVAPLATGLAIQLVAAARAGRPSLPAAIRRMRDHLAALVGTGAITLALSWLPPLLPWGSGSPVHVAAAFALSIAFTLATMYVLVRLFFARQAIIIDRLPLLEALRRSWRLTAGNVLGIVVLAVLLALPTLAVFVLLVFLAGGFAAMPWHVFLLAGALWGPIATAVLTEAYLQIAPGPETLREPLPGGAPAAT